MLNSQSKDYVIFNPVGNVFVGPSVEGEDKEYIKVVGGKVNRRIPSYATKTDNDIH